MPFAAFDYREEDDGWTVFDERAGEPAVLNGVPQTGLEIEEAHEIASALNRVAIVHPRGEA